MCHPEFISLISREQIDVAADHIRVGIVCSKFYLIRQPLRFHQRLGLMADKSHRGIGTPFARTEHSVCIVKSYVVCPVVAGHDRQH